MVKLFNKEHTFQHPFHCVTSAFFRKYPNPLSPQLKIIDTFDRRIDEQGPLPRLRHSWIVSRCPPSCAEEKSPRTSLPASLGCVFGLFPGVSSLRRITWGRRLACFASLSVVWRWLCVRE